MKTVIYCRVSSKEQEETGYSLPAQKKLLAEYAQRKNLVILKEFSVAESASGAKQRKVFEEMIEFMKKKEVSILLCEKVDRLTRNLKEAVVANDWIEADEKRQIHFVKQNLIIHKNAKSDEKFRWDIEIVLAKKFIANLSEEVKKGQKEKLAQGWLPSAPKLGYKTTGEKGHKIHIIDNKKAPLVKKMFELYATGNYSLKKLVEIMYNEGLRTKLGNQLVKSRLANLLSDPFYCGINRWKKEITDGKQEPLIIKELFDKVQNVLHNKSTPKYSKHFYEFKGLLKCAECGGKITWEKHKGIIYGHCNHYRNCSQDTWVKEPAIEKQLLKTFDLLRIKNARLSDWIQRALKENHKDEIDYHKSVLSELNKRYEQIQKRLDRLYDDKLDDTITQETYNRKFQQFTSEKNDIIQSIQKHSDANTKYFELGINIYNLSQRAKEIFSMGNVEQKRQLLGLIFAQVELNAETLNYTYTKPFEILSGAINTTNNCSKEVKTITLPIKNFELSDFPLKNAKIGVKNSDLSNLLRG